MSLSDARSRGDPGDTLAPFWPAGLGGAAVISDDVTASRAFGIRPIRRERRRKRRSWGAVGRVSRAIRKYSARPTRANGRWGGLGEVAAELAKFWLVKILTLSMRRDAEPTCKMIVQTKEKMFWWKGAGMQQCKIDNYAMKLLAKMHPTLNSTPRRRIGSRWEQIRTALQEHMFAHTWE